MDTLTVLIAHEHRAQRDTLAAALPLLCPKVRVHTSTPEDLDAAVLRLAPTSSSSAIPRTSCGITR